MARTPGTRTIQIAENVEVEVVDNPIDAHRFFKDDKDGDPYVQAVEEGEEAKPKAKAKAPANKAKAPANKSAQSTQTAQIPPAGDASGTPTETGTGNA